MPEDVAAERLPADGPHDWDLAPCGHLRTGTDGLVVDVNTTFLEWTGWTRDELVGRMRLVDLLTPGGRIYHETHYAPLLRLQGTVREIALTLRTAGGGRLPVLLSSRVVPVGRADSPTSAHDRDAGRGDDGHVVLTSVFSAADRRAFEQELVASRRHAERASHRLRLLQTVASDLAAAGDPHEVDEVLVDAARRAVGADRAVLWTHVEAARALVPDAVEGPAEPAPLRLPMSAEAARDLDLVSGAVLVLPVSESAARFPLATRSLADGPGLVVLAPFVHRGRVDGLLGCFFRGRERLDEEHLELLDALVGQAALAVPRTRLFAEQRDAVETLQRSLLPPSLPGHPSVELATTYRPARDGPAVGGDWYDAFWVGTGRLAVVVGDVVGRGVGAAAVMGQLRSAVRALGSVTPDPAQVLEGLDHFVDGVPAATSATVVYGVLDLAGGELLYGCAGHPPPVLLGPDGTAGLLWGGRSAPLGVRLPGGRPEAAVHVPAGSRLLLYTDGLVERRDVGLDERIAQLAEVTAAHGDLATPAMVAAVADAMLLDPGVPDDVCVLGLTLHGG
ncbi:SpoIIE family protein phosphatase [Thalassiella azotivora]